MEGTASAMPSLIVLTAATGWRKNHPQLQAGCSRKRHSGGKWAQLATIIIDFCWKLRVLDARRRRHGRPSGDVGECT
jgi:hypothetical protein